jgi:hypothetical protein
MKAPNTAEADRVVNGAGRVANVDTLDLTAGKVEHSNGRVAVDRHLRSTSNPQVYVCGDAVPISPQLSPIATYEGDIVGRNIVEGPKYSPDYASMATSVYTVPALAAVGLTEAAANQKGFAINVHTNDMHDWFSARTYAETVAWSKIIVDQAPTAFSARISSAMPARSLSMFSRWRCVLASPPVRSRTSSTPIRRFLRHQAHARTLSTARIALRYRLKSQPAFPRRRISTMVGRIAGQIIRAMAKQRRQRNVQAHRKFARALARRRARLRHRRIGRSDVERLCRRMPADKMKPNAREKVDFKPVGVTDVTLGSINLEKQPANLKDRELRFRKLTIEPGGIVPWHSHDDRPALIYRSARRDRRIRQQLRRADRAQGRRYQARSVRHLALVEESGHPDRHSLCRRRPQGSARPQYVTSAHDPERFARCRM